ncbi:MAG: hydroxyacid-oxoacid transhydrogenase [Thermomicrobiales bacterium]
MALETVFSTEASSVVFGPGATREVGPRMKALGVNRVLLVTDPVLVNLEPVAIALDSLRMAGLDVEVFSDVRVEPNDASWAKAIAVAQAGNFDGYVSVGGGSAMDTAKIADLYATHPADFLDYVYLPLGRGIPVPGPLKPHIAIPTTAGTGAETTGNAVFDLTTHHVKTTVSHRFLRPTLGIVDPDNTRTMPPLVAAASGLDVMSHALESFTAIPYSTRVAPDDPMKRTVYQGANPLSDIWSARAIELCARYLVRAVMDPEDDEARTNMMLASTTAGIGFGNAGVHLPHAMSYPVSALARNYFPEGYPDDHAMVPHGISVILTAPAIFRWTSGANPDRHLEAARLMGVDVRGASPEDGGALLSEFLVDLMKRVEMPNGLNGVGITEDDLPALVKGTIPQQRITQLSPRPATDDDYAVMFREAIRYW